MELVTFSHLTTIATSSSESGPSSVLVLDAPHFDTDLEYLWPVHEHTSALTNSVVLRSKPSSVPGHKVTSL
ncbi:hypothetical protein G9P44_005047 [Scheffersomyces stipitis]|nr:hypothetical protein G9P44_005047 [Scheffersomyces stipitis]